MKKIFTSIALLLAAICIPLAAQAGMIIKYDLGILGQTDPFDRLSIATIDATSNYAAGIFPGATFSDTGDFQVGSLTNGGAVVDDKGLSTNWELTGRWTNLSGVLTSIGVVGSTTTYNFLYNSGTAEMWDGTGPTKNVTPASFGGVGSDDDTAGDFTDGVKVATLSLVSGNGILGITPNFPPLGATQTTWAFDDVISGFWLDAGGNDLENILENFGYMEISTQVTNVALLDTNFDNIPDKINSRNTGDAEVSIPEPATLLLLGSGLLGLAGARRRK